jgi:hypothetical protein
MWTDSADPPLISREDRRTELGSIFEAILWLHTRSSLASEPDRAACLEVSSESVLLEDGFGVRTRFQRADRC